MASANTMKNDAEARYARRPSPRYFDISMIAVPVCEMERLPVLPRRWRADDEVPPLCELREYASVRGRR